MSGTEIGYAATSERREQPELSRDSAWSTDEDDEPPGRYLTLYLLRPIVLYLCYGMSGTGRGYAPTLCYCTDAGYDATRSIYVGSPMPPGLNSDVDTTSSALGSIPLLFYALATRACPVLTCIALESYEMSGTERGYAATSAQRNPEVRSSPLYCPTQRSERRKTATIGTSLGESAVRLRVLWYICASTDIEGSMVVFPDAYASTAVTVWYLFFPSWYRLVGMIHSSASTDAGMMLRASGS
eukprot:2059379-Rhodomonas_salina.1